MLQDQTITSTKGSFHVNFSYKLVIPKKYLIPEELLQEFLNFISINLPLKKIGRPQKNNESLVAGMYYLLKTGCQWDALPLCFGASKTIYHRFIELVKLGAFQKIWKNDWQGKGNADCFAGHFFSGNDFGG